MIRRKIGGIFLSIAAVISFMLIPVLPIKADNIVVYGASGSATSSLPQPLVADTMLSGSPETQVA
ncbi:MAG: hypothetical protein P8J68_01350 [Arenicellaceae bacterium]|nr:hypothetical protein [Arenicellaceae bacterium]